MRHFSDRRDAGLRLAEAIAEHPLPSPVVLALPRGGVPVALEIARRLRAPLDLIMVRKIGVPWYPELAAAAVVDGDRPERVDNPDVVAQAGLGEAELAAAEARELAEIDRRRAAYLRGRAPLPLDGRDAIVVDDGIATGATLRAALLGIRRRRPRSLTLAVPVAPAEALDRLAPEVDGIVCLATPNNFHAIGAAYADFAQLTDAEVVALLAEADAWAGPPAGPPPA